MQQWWQVVCRLRVSPRGAAQPEMESEEEARQPVGW